MLSIFYFDKIMTTLNIALIGPGLVGKEFFNQIKEFTFSKFKFKVVGVMSSRFMKIDLNGIDNIGLLEYQDKNRFDFGAMFCWILRLLMVKING